MYNSKLLTHPMPKYISDLLSCKIPQNSGQTIKFRRYPMFVSPAEDYVYGQIPLTEASDDSAT